MSTDTAEALFAELLAGIGELPASLTIPLEPPVIFDNGTYAELVLREPTADEVRQAEEQLRTGPHLPHTRRNFQMHLVAKAAGVPFPVVQKVGVAKVQTAMAYLSLFLGVGQGTGAN